MLAIALPAVALFITIDPTDLADGLAQTLRLPARFVLGALAGLRLIGLAGRGLAFGRASLVARRGVGDRNAVRRFFGMAFALLVLSIRRGSVLATAMEARGFGAPDPPHLGAACALGCTGVGRDTPRARGRWRGGCGGRRDRALHTDHRWRVMGGAGDKTLGRRILIDGRSGSGKTELARAIVDDWPGAQLVRLDEVYPGWHGLAAASSSCRAS